MALVSYFCLYIIIFLGLTVKPWVSEAKCNPHNQRFDDVPVVVTNRMYKPNTMNNVDYLFPNSTYSEKQRNNVRKFYGTYTKMGKINDSDGADILYDVQYCGKWTKENILKQIFYGIMAPRDDEEELRKVFEMVKEKGRKKILFTMHGINTQPLGLISDSDTFNEKQKDYLAVPIVWKNSGESLNAVKNICEDWEENAPKIAHELSDLWPILEVIKKRDTYPMSLMAHSLGNHVLSIFAESRSYDAYKYHPDRMFKDIYMVAPAVEVHMFNSKRNNAFATYTASLTPNNRILEEKFDQGNGISLLTDKVHVLWNKNDYAGKIFGIARGILLKLYLGGCIRDKGLLNNGDQAKKDIHRDLKDKVDFYHIQNTTLGIFDSHSYQFFDEAVSYYIANCTN